MNLCRTCQNWRPHGNAHGAGYCSSIEAIARLVFVTANQPFITAHNFGCVCYEEGAVPYTEKTIYSPEERRERLLEFVRFLSPP